MVVLPTGLHDQRTHLPPDRPNRPVARNQCTAPSTALVSVSPLPSPLSTCRDQTSCNSRLRKAAVVRCDCILYDVPSAYRVLCPSAEHDIVIIVIIITENTIRIYGHYSQIVGKLGNVFHTFE